MIGGYDVLCQDSFVCRNSIFLPPGDSGALMWAAHGDGASGGLIDD